MNKGSQGITKDPCQISSGYYAERFLQEKKSVYECEKDITKIEYENKDSVFLNPGGNETYCYYYKNSNPPECRELMFPYFCKEEDLCKKQLLN